MKVIEFLSVVITLICFCVIIIVPAGFNTSNSNDLLLLQSIVLIALLVLFFSVGSLIVISKLEVK